MWYIDQQRRRPEQCVVICICNKTIPGVTVRQQVSQSFYPQRQGMRTAFALFSLNPWSVAVRVVTAPVCGESYRARSCSRSEAHRHDELSNGGMISTVCILTMRS